MDLRTRSRLPGVYPRTRSTRPPLIRRPAMRSDTCLRSFLVILGGRVIDTTRPMPVPRTMNSQRHFASSQPGTRDGKGAFFPSEKAGASLDPIKDVTALGSACSCDQSGTDFARAPRRSVLEDVSSRCSESRLPLERVRLGGRSRGACDPVPPQSKIDRVPPVRPGRAALV